ncbi:MAG: ParB N-terminal domain-containing protein [bacterium]|nr:ParB N-terminal domain-containing protein [bacterium]
MNQSNNKSTHHDLIAEITKHSQDGQLEKWIDTFLRAEGKNSALADGLKKRKRYWAGPMLFPLKKLERCCGPEKEMEYQESIENWNRKVNSLIEYIQSEGDLAPFIVSYAGGIFSVRDGNHRYGAYEKLGREKYWALIWCDSEEELEEIKNLRQ